MGNPDSISKKLSIQEHQYRFPYHYIPSFRNGIFSQNLYWSWGFRYLGGLEVAIKQLEGIQFQSLIDIGCGDGRFIHELIKIYPDIHIIGIDISEKAIKMAVAMNHTNNFIIGDINKYSASYTFDIATMIEVLEHIPENQVSICLESIYRILKPDGYLLLSVPHTNKSVSEKHFQHFNSSSLSGYLEPYFEDITFVPFDIRSRLLNRLSTLIGGDGRNYLITNPRILSWFFRLYQSRYLYAEDERKCLRIMALCRKKT